MPTAMVDVKRADHRALRLGSLDALHAEIDRLATLERAGTLRRSGNWTLGQTLGHLAFWQNAPYDGYPPELRPPWIIKVLLRSQKRKFMKGPMPRGVSIPKIDGGTLGREELSIEEGCRRITDAIARLRAGPPAAPNIIFGPLSHEEWKALNLRHAELHLGYFDA